MLQETQRTSAPSATRVSMSTAVWTVMCSEPAIRAPASGWLGLVLTPDRHQAGHLVLGQPDLVAAGLGQGQVGHGELESPCCCTVVRMLTPRGTARTVPIVPEESTHRTRTVGPAGK